MPRSLFRTICAAALALAASALSAPVSAGPLVSASFSLDTRAGSGPLPVLTIAGAGATGTATSDLSVSLAGAGVFDGSVTTILPTSASPPLTAVQVVITKNAGATFAGTASGKVGGNLAIEGVLAFYGIGGFPTFPLLSVPLELGTPSTIAQSSGGVAITAIAGSWTAGTATVTGVDLTDTTAEHTVTAMGSNALTPGGAGTLVLVTPLKVISSIAGNFANFGALTLTYAPEPGTLVLCGLGIAALGAWARRCA
jgi:hypothetical protein